MKKEIVDAIQQIRTFMAQEKYDEAYSLCNKALLNFPENRRLKQIQGNIEEIVYKRNISSVKKDLKTLEPLWKEEKYEELVAALNELLSYVPGFKPVERSLIKAQKLYRKQLESQRNSVVKDHIVTIKESLKTNKFKEAMTLAKQLLVHIPGDSEVTKYYEKAKELYIDHEINSKMELLTSNKYDKIEMFLKDLLRFDPQSKKIQSLIHKIANRENVFLEFAKKDFSYKSYEELLVLYQKKKYDKVVEGIQELIALEPDNFKFLELKQKAERKFRKQLNKESTNKVLTLNRYYKKLYSKIPDKFIRI